MNHTSISEKKMLWVLGHKIEPMKASGQYDAVRITTAPGVQGPPPHHHDTYAEMFIVISGKAQFLQNGEVSILGPGESVDLSPGVVHTVSNAGDEDLVMINIHSPKGFMAFFDDVGFDVNSNGSFDQSISQETVGKVIRDAASYDMHIHM